MPIIGLGLTSLFYDVLSNGDGGDSLETLPIVLGLYQLGVGHVVVP